MARPGGNPDFGIKYRFDYGKDKLLSEQVKVLMHPEVKQQLKELAEQKKCEVACNSYEEARTLFSRQEKRRIQRGYCCSNN